MRISPNTGKTHGTILDQSGNLHQLGFPEDVQHYYLPTSCKLGESGTAPKKQYPLCNLVVLAFVMECLECGHKWLVEEPQIITEDLVEVVDETREEALDEQEMIQFFHYQRQKTYQEGYAPTLTMRAFFENYNFLPKDDWCLGSTFGSNPTHADKQAYKHYLAAIAHRQGKSISWVISELQREFGMKNWQDVFM